MESPGTKKDLSPEKRAKEVVESYMSIKTNTNGKWNTQLLEKFIRKALKAALRDQETKLKEEVGGFA